MINNLQKNPKDENEFDIRVLMHLPKNQKDEYSMNFFIFFNLKYFNSTRLFIREIFSKSSKNH